jgi:hypothetical protein
MITQPIDTDQEYEEARRRAEQLFLAGSLAWLEQRNEAQVAALTPTQREAFDEISALDLDNISSWMTAHQRRALSQASRNCARLWKTTPPATRPGAKSLHDEFDSCLRLAVLCVQFIEQDVHAYADLLSRRLIDGSCAADQLEAYFKRTVDQTYTRKWCGMLGQPTEKIILQAVHGNLWAFVQRQATDVLRGLQDRAFCTPETVTLASFVRSLMKRNGWSIHIAAGKIDCTYNVVRDILNGKTKTVRTSTLEGIPKAAGMPLERLPKS